MRDPLFDKLLTDIHASIDRLADDLQGDRPELARALRCQTAWIPVPEPARQPGRRPSTTAACAALPPLYYQALDAGIIDAKRFDAMMLRHVRAQRAVGSRK